MVIAAVSTKTGKPGSTHSVLEEIAAHTSRVIGQEFLAALVRSMRNAMQAKLVFITRGLGAPPRRARSVACWNDAGATEPFEYDLEGTPCQIVYGGEAVIVTEGLYKRFAKEKPYEGYLGVPLMGSRGKVIGHFAVLTDAPLAAPSEAMAILRLFSLRAEAELGRIEHESEREELIASLVAAQRRLSGRHRALHNSNATKTQLLHMMAHDLRSPLSVILSRGELIGALTDKGDASGVEVAKVHESSAIIVNTAERMARMVASTLDQARHEAAAIAVDTQTFPAERALDAAISLNQPSAERKSIVIVRNLPRSVMVQGDEDRVVEALDNLISNALKYSEPGKRIEASLSEDEHAVHFNVRDEGPGLTEHDLARAFRQFERLSAKPTAGESSTGLGLFIVRSIAEAHGGSASVESAGTGKGAKFRFSLPRGS